MSEEVTKPQFEVGQTVLILAANHPASNKIGFVAEVLRGTPQTVKNTDGTETTVTPTIFCVNDSEYVLGAFFAQQLMAIPPVVTSPQ